MAKTHQISSTTHTGSFATQHTHAHVFKDNPQQRWQLCKHLKLTSTKQLTHLLILTLMAVLTQIPHQSRAAPLDSTSSPSSSSTPLPTDVNEDTFDLGLSLQQLAQFSDPGHKHLRKRHRAPKLAEIAGSSDQQFLWQNACDGQWIEMDPKSIKKPNRSKVIFLIRDFKNVVGAQVNVTRKWNAINIKHMAQWGKHAQDYKFLPTLKKNSIFKPRLWHRGLQKYIAAFAFLGSTQYHWDRRSGVTHELNELLNVARSTLCNLEYTINGTTPHSPHKLEFMSQEQMNTKLHFYSRNENEVQLRKGAVPLDLRFTKSRFENYLRKMHNILKRTLKQKRVKLSAENTASKADSDYSMESRERSKETIA